MLRGLYTSASGMKASQQQNNTISNNLANINTTGYKKDRAIQKSFAEEMVTRIDQQATNIGKGGSGVAISETATDHSTGSFRQTDGQLDWAIDGSGFFVVQTPEGKRYTRQGEFTINNQNQIVTQQGHPVQGAEGVLQVAPNSESVNLKDNQLVVDGNVVNTVQVRDFANKSSLVKEANNLFRRTPETGQAFAAQAKVKQGYLEGSNVNPIQEMVKMIETSRQYQADQKMIKSHDQTLGKAVNEVGKV
ncbi:flagellar basal-body rod protein FlgF [Halanaerobaculum tunisiense]